mgnify:CR=1 FL=1
MMRQAEQATCLKQASRIMTQGMYIPSHFKPESLSRLEVATLAHRKGRSDENSECRGAIALSARARFGRFKLSPPDPSEESLRHRRHSDSADSDGRQQCAVAGRWPPTGWTCGFF